MTIHQRGRGEQAEFSRQHNTVHTCCHRSRGHRLTCHTLLLLLLLLLLYFCLMSTHCNGNSISDVAYIQGIVHRPSACLNHYRCTGSTSIMVIVIIIIIVLRY